MFGQLGLPTERRDLQSLAVRCQAPLGAQQDRVAAAVETFFEDLSGLERSTDLFNRWAALLTGPLQVAGFQVFLHDDFSQQFVRVQCHPPRPLVPLEGVSVESALVRYFQQREVEHLEACPVVAVPEDPLGLAAAGWLREAGQELAVPLTAGRSLLGLITLTSPHGPAHWTLNRVAVQALVAHAVSASLQRLLAQERLDLVGYVSRGLAHDLRNLLTPIATCLQLGAEGGGSPAKMRALLPLALRNLELLQRQLERTQRPVGPGRTGFATGSLDELIRAAATWVGPEAAHRQVQIQVSAAAALRLKMDGVLILRLLVNLLTNALRNAPAGSEVRLDWRLTTDGLWAELTVTDQGPGMAPEQLSQLLLPPLLVANLPEAERPSRLGLAICREIVALHGGRLELQSELGRGTTALVQLPRDPAAGA